MYIVDLQCESGHLFEGWYDSASEYKALASEHEVTCPLCEGPAERRLSAPRISTATTRGEKRSAPPSASPAPAMAVPLEVQKALAAVVQHVRKTHEDVGEQFATRAIAMHRGDEASRPIRGTATEAEEKQLEDEGVLFAKVPIPDIETN